MNQIEGYGSIFFVMITLQTKAVRLVIYQQLLQLRDGPCSTAGNWTLYVLTGPLSCKTADNIVDETVGAKRNLGQCIFPTTVPS